MVYKLDFTTFYNQFYISSDNGKAALSSGELEWSDTAYNNRLGTSPNFIAVYPESYGHIQGELHVLNAPSENDFDAFDHVVEGGLNVESGLLQILDCPNSAVELELKMKPGIYRVRIYFSNMVGYDSDEKESNDRCMIQLWPCDNIDIRVLKNFPRNFETI